MCKYTKILVCAPGLRFQFYTNGFDKRNIIYLSVMEYVENDVKPVISKINDICYERKT